MMAMLVPVVTTTTMMMASSWSSLLFLLPDDDNVDEASSSSSSSSSSLQLLESRQRMILPVLLVGGTFWCGVYLYGRYQLHREFGRWDAMHNFHHGVAMSLATLSLTHWIPEYVPIGFSLCYFTVDAMDCLARGDYEYLFHAVICLVLGVANYQEPIFYQLQMNSKATYCELSTPLLHWSKRTRRPAHFLCFALVFTLCRMVWIPIMYRQLLMDGHIPPHHPMMIVLGGFYALNGLWWIKILRILYKGMATTTTQPTDDDHHHHRSDDGSSDAAAVAGTTSSSVADVAPAAIVGGKNKAE